MKSILFSFILFMSFTIAGEPVTVKPEPPEGMVYVPAGNFIMDSKYGDPDERPQHIANQIFEGVLKLEKVTGVPGLVARSFNRTDIPQWHEKVFWYDEWHWSTFLPGYRWLGDLSADKFTSIFYGVGTFWEFCADEKYLLSCLDTWHEAKSLGLILTGTSDKDYESLIRCSDIF